MGVLYDCRTETIEQYGKCLEGSLPAAEPDIVRIAGIGLTAYQLAAMHVLFITILTIIFITVNQKRLKK